VLSDEEEASVVKWVLKMEDGQSVSIQQLKLKVAEITQSRPTPFTKGIPGDSWWNLFKRRHPDLSIGVTEVRQSRFKPFPSMFIFLYCL
jgi:hypothetical protein